MRRQGRIDANQNEIVKALRDYGASVSILSSVGKGFPDICVGYEGMNYLFEIKDGNKPPSQRKLTPDEQKFFKDWNGSCDVVCSVKDCIEILKNHV